jgi:hypothetical protein
VPKKEKREMNSARVALAAVLCASTVVGWRQTLTAQQATLPAEPVLSEQQQTPDTVVKPEDAAPNRQLDSGSVIGHLKTRDKLITIRTGSHGPVYTVKSEDGTVLAVNLPASEISARFPDLKGIVERGVARGRVWAGL